MTPTEALIKIREIAVRNYEQDEKLRANGARALKRIADICDEVLDKSS